MVPILVLEPEVIGKISRHLANHPEEFLVAIFESPSCKVVFGTDTIIASSLELSLQMIALHVLGAHTIFPRLANRSQADDWLRAGGTIRWQGNADRSISCTIESNWWPQKWEPVVQLAWARPSVQVSWPQEGGVRRSQTAYGEDIASSLKDAFVATSIEIPL